jgi:hypothetical protein
MRRAMLLAVFMTGIVACALGVEAHDHGFSYPKVRTFSGGYYGPTQAHFQYQRRYGRPWHGHGGFTTGAHFGAVHGHHLHHGGFGGIIGGWALPYASFGYVTPFDYSPYYFGYPAFGYPAPPPMYGDTTSPTLPAWVLPPIGMHPALSDAWDQNLQQWEQPLDLLPVISSGKPALPPSTPAARMRSLQLQQQGDRRLRELDYFQASVRYRDAISAAADRAEPHVHLALAFAGMKRFEDAVKELKVGLALDPAWPASGASLDGLLGEENLIGKMHLKQRVAEWALHDVRDPDRLFLLGAFLFLDNDLERGRYILETAARLGGLHEHLAVFLRGDRPAAADVSSGPPAPAEDAAADPLPEAPPRPAPPSTVTPPKAEDHSARRPPRPAPVEPVEPENSGPAFPE